MMLRAIGAKDSIIREKQEEVDKLVLENAALHQRLVDTESQAACARSEAEHQLATLAHDLTVSEEERLALQIEVAERSELAESLNRQCATAAEVLFQVKQSCRKNPMLPGTGMCMMQGLAPVRRQLTIVGGKANCKDDIRLPESLGSTSFLRSLQRYQNGLA